MKHDFKVVGWIFDISVCLETNPRVNHVIVLSFDSRLKNMNSKVVGKTETVAIWTISHYLFSVNKTFVFWNRQEWETLGTKDLGVIVCGLLWCLWCWLVTWGVRVQELVWWVGTTWIRVITFTTGINNCHTRQRQPYSQPEHLTSSSANVLLEKRHGLRTCLHHDITHAVTKIWLVN